jgi:uncharacterized protein YoxC
MPTPNNSQKRDRESESPENKIDHRDKLPKMNTFETFSKKVFDKLDKFDETITKNTNQLAELTNELRSDVKTIKHKLSELEIRIQELEQSNNKASLMITGLPTLERDSNSAFENTAKVVNKLGISLDVADVKAITVVNYKSGNGSFIIAHFWNERKKAEILHKFKLNLRQNLPMLLNDVFTIAENSPLHGKQIRIKTLLTKYNADLLRQAQAFKQKPFAFVWESNGKILVKRNEGDKPTIV